MQKLTKHKKLGGLGGRGKGRDLIDYPQHFPTSKLSLLCI